MLKSLSISARASITNGRNVAFVRERERERKRKQISKRLIIRGDGYPTFRVSREQMEMPRAHRTVERKIKKIRSKTMEERERERERRIHKSWRESLVRETIVEKYPRARCTHNRRD